METVSNSKSTSVKCWNVTTSRNDALIDTENLTLFQQQKASRR